MQTIWYSLANQIITILRVLKFLFIMFLKPFYTDAKASLRACCTGLCALFLLAVFPALAEPEDCSKHEKCVETDQWSIGVAIGLGAKSNPINGGDAIPQVLLLDIAWYGENVYFDNGELGYRWLQDQDFSVESYVTFDRERAFFIFWDPANILVNTGVSSSDNPNTGEDNVSLERISSRNWALIAGTKAHYYTGSHKWSLGIESDISGVHSGQRITLSYRKMWNGDDWRFQLKPSVVYKSDKLVDYYYGLNAQDNVPPNAYFEGSGGFQPSLSALYIQDLNEDWQLIVSGSYQYLHMGMTNSPLVDQKHVSNVFIGFGYRF